MRRDKDNSKFDFEKDEKFNENFKKNIEKALDNSDAAVKKPEVDIKAEEKTENKDKTTPSEDNTADKAAENTAENTIDKAAENTAENTTDKTAENATENTTDKANRKDKDVAADEKKSANNEKVTDKNNSVEGIDSAKDKDAEDETFSNEDPSIAQEPVTADLEDDLADIKSSLAKQISNEMDSQAAEIDKMKKKKRLFKIESGVVLTVLCLIGFGFFFGFTKPGNSILMSMGINVGGTVWDTMTNKFDDSTKVKEDVDYLDEEDLKSTAPTVAPEQIVWPDHPGEGKHEEGVYNILLLGEEAIGMGDGRGHTDVMVIATLNTKTKAVKLTSLMRDTLVQIPGYNDNKLNSAYAKGGLDMLYETISNNFDIKLDGCVKVNFKNFDKIVDSLGGLDIKIKQNEADYLNTTNYISIKKYRTLKEGLNHMNGNQVLGYARVRKTSTITGMNNDYGRTDRHRIVLNAIYEKCRSKSKAELLQLMFKFLPLITTDIDSNCFEQMLNAYVDGGINSKEIEQLRIPVDGTFKDNIKVRGMSVVIADLDANRKALSKFIFGDEDSTITKTDSSN